MILCGGVRSGSGDARFEGEYQSVSWATCASAPSHTLHAMPPRITRDSHRPRASDRTMITTQTSASLAQLSNSTGVVVAGRGNPKEPPTTRTNLSRERTDSGLDLDTKNPLDLRSRENSFLDIPFYRTQRLDAAGNDTKSLERQESVIIGPQLDHGSAEQPRPDIRCECTPAVGGASWFSPTRSRALTAPRSMFRPAVHSQQWSPSD